MLSIQNGRPPLSLIDNLHLRQFIQLYLLCKAHYRSVEADIHSWRITEDNRIDQRNGRVKDLEGDLSKAAVKAAHELEEIDGLNIIDLSQVLTLEDHFRPDNFPTPPVDTPGPNLKTHDYIFRIF